MTQKHELAIQELRRQAAIQKTLWKRQLSQQSTYKAEIHELHTEMLNMREKSEMQSHLAANMCKLEHSIPSRSVESEPENVLNTRSPGRCSSWILPSEMETPDRPTPSGLQSPMGAPVQLDPSPQAREYSRPSPCCIPPAQWGDMHARDPGEEECELFGEVCLGHDESPLGMPSDCEARQGELDNAAASRVSDSMAAILERPRCINGQLVRPTPPSDDSPSTARQPSMVRARRSILRAWTSRIWSISRQNSISSDTAPSTSTSANTSWQCRFQCPREWTPLHTRPKASERAGPPDGPGGGTGSGAESQPNPAGNPHPGGGAPGSSGSGGAQPRGGGHPGGCPGGNATPPGSTPPQQTGGAGNPGGSPPTTPPGLPQSSRYIDPWASLDRSRKPFAEAFLAL